MDLPFISLDYGYFLNISASLDSEEAGAWMLLYSHAWGRGGALIDDDDRLCRLCRLTKRKWLQIRPVVLSDWRSDSGQLFNDVLTKEYARALKNKSEKVKAGKARQNGKSQTNQGDNASTAQAALNASPSPSPSPSIEKENFAKEKAGASHETNLGLLTPHPSQQPGQPDATPSPDTIVMFEALFAIWPAKKKKPQARQAYTIARNRGVAHETMTAGARRFAKYHAEQKTKEQFLQSLDDWINSDGWTSTNGKSANKKPQV